MYTQSRLCRALHPIVNDDRPAAGALSLAHTYACCPRAGARCRGPHDSTAGPDIVHRDERDGQIL